MWVFHDHDCDLWVTMVGWVDVLDNDWGDFRRWCAIDISNCFRWRLIVARPLPELFLLPCHFATTIDHMSLQRSHKIALTMIRFKLRCFHSTNWFEIVIRYISALSSDSGISQLNRFNWSHSCRSCFWSIASNVRAHGRCYYVMKDTPCVWCCENDFSLQHVKISEWKKWCYLFAYKDKDW